MHYLSSCGTQNLHSLNIIQRFKNDACAGTSARNGTCYTEAECTNKNGANAGSCAQVGTIAKVRSIATLRHKDF